LQFDFIGARSDTFGISQGSVQLSGYHSGNESGCVANWRNCRCLRPDLSACGPLHSGIEWQSRTHSTLRPKRTRSRKSIFNFYDGELFRILVHYNHVRAGRADGSKPDQKHFGKAGAPTRTAGKISIYSATHLYIQDERVIARWEDSRYSVNLFRLSSKATLGMLIFQNDWSYSLGRLWLNQAGLDGTGGSQKRNRRQRPQERVSAQHGSAFENPEPY